MALALRPAEPADARFVWEVNNDPSVRAQSISTSTIPWESHVGWYERKLADPAALLLVAEDDGTPAGVVRFDVDGERATVSVAVSSTHRGKGLGARAIDAGTTRLHARFPHVRAVAWIRPSNTASLRAFAAAGYERVGTDVQDGVTLERYERCGAAR